MVYYNKNIEKLIEDPVYIFKIDNFFDLTFYSDIRKIFNKISSDKLNLNDNFGKKFINASDTSYENENYKKIFEKLNDVFLSNDFFNFFVKKFFFKNIKNQNNFFRKIKYMRYPIKDNYNNSLLDFLYSKISVKYSFSYIKNKGGIVPHVDSQRKYLSLMLYFPDDEKKEIEYGTTFWNSNIPNYSNTHISDNEKIREFKSKSTQLYKTKFVPNCLYGFLRNDFSWHTVEPIDISNDYVRKSININFTYNN